MLSWQRAVIKVGSALTLPGTEGGVSTAMAGIAAFIRACLDSGKDMILVSSGSVAAGRVCFSYRHRQLSIPLKQAMAAVFRCPLRADFVDAWRSA